MAKEKVNVGWFSVGGRGVYTVSLVRDEEGRCNRCQVTISDLPELGIKRHPNIGKTVKFFNSTEGYKLLDKLNGEWFTEFARSKKLF